MDNHPLEYIADCYGPEPCFLDHRAGFFSFEECAKQLRALPDPRDHQGLIQQSGLRVASIPDQSVQTDMFHSDRGRDALDRLSEPAECAPNWISPCLSLAARLKELDLPLELVDLGPDPNDEPSKPCQAARGRIFNSPLQQWIPLCRGKDITESLQFPPDSAKLRKLLLREVDREKISISRQALRLTRTESTRPRRDSCERLSNCSVFLPHRNQRANFVTPPLSPISEDTQRFIPELETCVVELTSEPNSPLDEILPPDHEDLEVKALDIKSCDSGDIAELGFPCPNTPKVLAVLTSKRRDVKVDAPVLCSSSSIDASDVDKSILQRVVGQNIEDRQRDDFERGYENYFEDAIGSILDASHPNTVLMAEQERLDPANSLARISVPVMDFGIPSSAWVRHISSAKTHFSWLQQSGGASLRNSLAPQISQHDRELKWAPLPSHSDQKQVALEETLGDRPDANRRLLSLGIPPTLSSARHLTQRLGLTISRVDEVEHLTLDPLDLKVQRDYTTKKPSQGQHSLQLHSSSVIPESSSLDTLVLSMSSKRHLPRSPRNTKTLLPSFVHENATSTLLSNFMEIRAAKRPRLANIVFESNEEWNTKAPFKAVQRGTETTQSASPRDEQEATHPIFQLDIPKEKAVFFISLSLPRAILKHIESSWPPDHLLDRDYSLYGSDSIPRSGCPKEAPLALAYEADMTLTPVVGVVTTSLTKVKQKSLPKDKNLPQIRQRLLKVSERYETLFVLVSSQSEDLKSPSNTSDKAAYADFESFTTNLGADIKTCFVPGGDVHLAAKLLDLMCQFTPQAIGFKSVLQAAESNWELCLRRTGMNVMAAQVLAGTLFKQAGNQGLALFASMSLKQRIDRYSQLLRGRKLLVLSSNSSIQVRT